MDGPILKRRLSWLVVAALLANGWSTDGHASSAMSLHDQNLAIPADFRDHFYGVPVAARLVGNGVYLGEAMIVLSADERVQLLHFTDTSQSEAQPALRDAIALVLADSVAIKPCSPCRPGAEHITYDHSTSTLEVFTTTGSARASGNRRTAPPRATGAIITQRVTMVSTRQHGATGRYWVESLGTARGWTGTASIQAERHAKGQGAPGLQVNTLHVQRELASHVVRAGLMTPDGAGLSGQPVTSLSSQRVIGLMYATSDRIAGAGNEATYPIYIAAQRPATLEVYRRGSLIHTSLLAPGLHPVDTTAWPSGIYEVDLRVIEAGTLIEERTEMVYKPVQWADTSKRWRYLAFTGHPVREDAIDRRKSAPLAMGAAIDVLVHPRLAVALGGVSARGSSQAAASADVEVADWMSFRAARHWDRSHGPSTTLQGLFRLPNTQLSLAYGDSPYRQWLDASPARRNRRWTIAATTRLPGATQVTARLGKSTTGQTLATWDVGISRLTSHRSASVQWRVSASHYQRGAGDRRRRERLVEAGVTIAFRQPRHAWSTSIGRHQPQGRDTTSFGGVRYDYQGSGLMPMASADLSTGARGLMGGASALVQGRTLRADAYARTLDGRATQGGVNLETTHAFASEGTASDSSSSFAEAAMVVSVEGDDDDLDVMATDNEGMAQPLQRGMNLLKVPAFVQGEVNFDAGPDSKAPVGLDTRAKSYHLPRGGVSYVTLKASRMITIAGRLVDGNGNPRNGVILRNGMRRTATDAAGVFTLEALAADPSLSAFRDASTWCPLQAAGQSIKATSSNAHGYQWVGDMTCAPMHSP